MNLEVMNHAYWMSSYGVYYRFDDGQGTGHTQDVTLEQLYLVRPVASLQGGYQVLSFLNLFGIAAVELHERNRLVSVDTYRDGVGPPEGPAPTTTYLMGILGLGVELKVSRAFADLIVFYPLHGEEDLEFGPAASVLVGATL